jgi:MFS family permease
MSSVGSNQNRRECWAEAASLAALVGLTIFYVSISWRKWCDPLVDFGDQLYTAWRLSEGAVLYRDVDLLYGPFSQYFNAALFALFGPGILVLVTANFIIFAAIVTVLYLLCRGAWGRIAAFVACALFIAVFGFSQFVHFGNLNYATPYSHETTHGMLVCLVLCLLLIRWIEDASPIRSLFAGALFGLTALLKPEIMFAAAVMTVVAGLTRWRSGGLPKTAAVAWAVAAVLPSAAFALYFVFVMPWTSALAAAGHGWLSLANTALTSDVLQRGFLGLDQPWQHLTQHAFATFVALFVIAVLAAVAWLAEKVGRAWLLVLVCAAAAAFFAWLSLTQIKWIDIGRCLLGLMSIYAVVSIMSILRDNQTEENSRHRISRLLLAVLAAALMSRMILNGRIYHYGYYQAALAAVILPAIIVSELPSRLRMTWRGSSVILIGALALLLPGVIALTKRSQNEFRWKTISIGHGRDQFFAFDPQLDPEGKMVATISEALQKDRNGPTLLVLPEGEMINYLARLRNPIPQFFFYDGVTADGGEDRIVKDLAAHPPYWVVIISRDLGEYGIDRYGEQPGEGREILSWVKESYKRVAAIGGDPLDYREHGAVILRKYHYP